MEGAVGRLGNAGARPAHDHDENLEARQFAQSVFELDISDCLTRVNNSRGPPHFAYPPERPMVWVKSGGPHLQAEGEMQSLAWRWVKSERGAGRCSPNIHIPEVFRIFTITTTITNYQFETGKNYERKGSTTFIIMELLDAMVLNKCSGLPFVFDDYCDLIAQGVQCLRRMPIPDDAMPGPYTKDPSKRPGIIRHPLFKEDKASVGYRNVEELEGHINRAINAMRRRNEPQLPPVHLERQLEFCYCDFNEENFMFNVDANGRLHLYIVDFEHASFLPSTFLAFALFRKDYDWTTIPPLAQRIGHTLSKANMESLRVAYNTFWTCPRSIGLKDRGKPARPAQPPHP